MMLTASARFRQERSFRAAFSSAPARLRLGAARSSSRGGAATPDMAAARRGQGERVWARPGRPGRPGPRSAAPPSRRPLAICQGVRGSGSVLCNAMPCHAMPCHAMPCHAMLCNAVLCCAVLCCAVLCSAMLCCNMLCYAVLCSAMPCCAVLRCATQCRNMAPDIHERSPSQRGGRTTLLGEATTGVGLGAVRPISLSSAASIMMSLLLALALLVVCVCAPLPGSRRLRTARAQPRGDLKLQRACWR